MRNDHAYPYKLTDYYYLALSKYLSKGNNYTLDFFSGQMF